ncbi:hypothetical protein NP493_673g02017 [Ridgeia piscesae]|uniref:EF-hand domain-containing protein n=1 Tax=Ridgeia piscesae TaxID=27915 RepID=A0AAD9KRR4_RIDPI|nr:hypothetical protein NP493_673g02017 [Ridgeia piscesae]
MSAKAARLLLELFRMLDFHCKMCLNDLQFCTFMRFASDMSRHKIYQVFDMLDVDRSGEMDFDEFYLMTSILVAQKDGDEKQGSSSTIHAPSST